MLFRPTAEQNLPAIRILLDAWNLEADRFRRAASAVRRGEPPDTLITQSVAEVLDDVRRVLTDIEGTLDRLPAGDHRLTELLQVLITAQALAESIERSWEVLDAAMPAAHPAQHVDEYSLAAQ